MDKLDSDFLKAVLRDIGLALHACHNTITSDSHFAELGEKCWRIDNSKEIDLVRKLERALLLSADSDREYSGRSTGP